MVNKIWEYIKINYKGIFRSISLICAFCLIIVLFTKKPQIPASTQITIDSLKAANKELVISNLQLNNKLIYFNLRVDTINSLLKTNNQQQNLLKEQYDKKINNINNFSSDDIRTYFIQNYSSGYPQIR